MQALAQQQAQQLAQAQAQAQSQAQAHVAAPQQQAQQAQQAQEQGQGQQQGGLFVWPWQQLFGASPDDGLIYPCVHARQARTGGRAITVGARTR